MSTLYRIVDWNRLFENNRTRELKKMDWIPVPNKQDGDGYTDLLSRKNGPALYGAWHAILQVASKCDVRGTLLRDCAVPHDSASISRMSHLPAALIGEAFAVLCEIGWIEVVKSLDNNDDTEIPHEGAALEPHPGAVSSVPFSSVPSEEKKGVQGEEKQKYVTGYQYVKITEPEYQKLLDRLGSDGRVRAAIEILENYFGAKLDRLKKYTSHYRAILSWVIKELDDRESKNGKRVLTPGRA